MFDKKRTITENTSHFGGRKKTSHEVDMLHGSLFDKILLFALPLAASGILQQLFNSADVAVVGHFAGSSAQAAVGSNSALINLLINLFTGLAVGANAVIAGYIGQGETDKIHKAVHTAVAVSLFSGVFLLVLGNVVSRPVLILMGTPSEVLDEAVLYLRLYFLGMPFIMFYNFGSAVLRSKGDSKRPLYSLIAAGVINVILNLILVIVFQLGVAGVAIATVISNIVSAGLVLHFLMTEAMPYHLIFPDIKIAKQPFVRILKIGIPAGVQGMVFSLSNVIIQSAINSFGPLAMAGSTNAWYFETFTYFVVNAFSQTTVTFTSQNYGAGDTARCRKVFRLCMMASIVFSGILSTVFVIGRNQFIRFYTTDEAVISFALVRMMHILVVQWLISTYEVGGSALRGMGYSMYPALITILGTCLFRIFWIYSVFAANRSFSVLMNVYPVSWILTGSIMLITYFFVRKRAFRLHDNKK